MFEINHLSILLNHHYLIQNLSFLLNKGDKLAIIGEEGNGKSTLLKAILGLADYAFIEGTIDFKGNRVGYLEQSMNPIYFNKTVFQYLFIDDFDYYNKVNAFYKHLDTMQLEDRILEQEIHTLSGGEKVKISILRLLLDEPDILFLDEPTNDLDIETLEWLEKFMNYTVQPIVYVSHDETLLSNTANMILHIEQIKNKTECRHTLSKTSYSMYIEQRLKALSKQAQMARAENREFHKKQEKLRQVMQKVEYQQETISRADPHGAQLLKKKMHTLKAQEKRLSDMELTEVPVVEEQINFFFDPVEIPRFKNIIHLNIPDLQLSGKTLCKNIVLDVIGNVHLCIIGKNGTGKSTLLKRMWEQLRDRKDLKVGYMPQNYEDVLENYESVLDFVSSSRTKEDMTKARMYLGNMNFTRDEMVGRIQDLSNGTKAKLFLIKFVIDQCDVLLLDEPTRNVSPLSNPVIRKILKEYQGTIISVSHDRKYIEEVADQIYILTPGGLIQRK